MVFLSSIKGQKLTKLIYFFHFSSLEPWYQQQLVFTQIPQTTGKSLEAWLDGAAHLWLLLYMWDKLILWVETKVYGNHDCLLTAFHSQAIGVTSSDAIPDDSFSASSSYNNNRRPLVGRLNLNSWGWSPKINTNPADYLQIDMLYDYVICAVATQGAVGGDQWITKYKIQLSLNDTIFYSYRENNAEKVSLIQLKYHANLGWIFFHIFCLCSYVEIHLVKPNFMQGRRIRDSHVRAFWYV